MSTDETALERSYRLLKVSPNVTLKELDIAYQQVSYQKLCDGADAEIDEIRAAYRALKAHLLTDGQSGQARSPAPLREPPPQTGGDRLTEKLRQMGLRAHIKIQDSQLHIGLLLQPETHQGAKPGVAIAKIYTCLETLDLATFDLTEVKSVTIYGLRAPKQAIWRETFTMPRHGLTRDDLDLFSFNNRLSNALVFPSILLLGMVASGIPLTQLLLRGIKIWMHEFGHATVAWLSGRQAIPLPFGWTNVAETRSPLVYLGVLTLLGLLVWSGWREERRWVMGLGAIGAIGQFYLTWLISTDTFTMLLAFGGIGGEFYLSTLLMVSFFFPLPASWRWDMWRYPAAFGAAFTFWDNVWRWHQIKTGEDVIPWGSMWGGEGDAGGDMNILSLDFGWSDQQIVDTYNSLSGLCLSLLLGVYGYTLLKQNHSFFFALWQRWRAGRTSF